MSATTRVRRATPDDLDPLAELMAEFHREDHVVTDEARARKALSGLLADPALGRVWVVAADDDIVAYVAIGFGFSLELGGKDAFVDEMYVRPAWRRQGLAATVLESAARDAAEAGARALHLEVGRGNGTARRVYERAGFIAREQYHLMTLSLGNLD
ncbi:MAG: GNAT family N-acetyltransferase [Thermoanaerobaculia bacterium]|nr:GNAT family N-acetyltransferase [Thermoanaerobaculia bacterium]